MPQFESKIGIYKNKNGRVTIETKILYPPKSTGRIAESQKQIFSSIDELRIAIAREQFHGKAVEGFKYFIAVATGLIFGEAAEEIFNTPPGVLPMIAGAAVIALGLSFRNTEHTESKVDSRVKAFNDTFPALKAITFNPRDYLSTLRLPSRR